MGRKQHNAKRGHGPGSDRSPVAGPAKAPPGAPRPGRRRWWFRFLALAVLPVLLVVALEGGLRVAGYGYPTGFFTPIRIGGQECLVDNDRFGLRFFPPALARLPAPVVMKARKPPGTVRIFIFGESAALGEPRPNYGAGRYLEVLLAERFPGTDFEIVNTAMTAINSHVILPLARECATRAGDLWILYLGNNEMVGPFGAATVFGRQAPPLRLVRLSLAVQQTRLGQLLMGLVQGLRKPSQPARWQGMEMFLHNKVPPADQRKEVVYENFRQNLADILRAGRGSGAKIVLSSVAANLKDCPPFASLSATNLPAGERAVFEPLWREGNQAWAQGHLRAAEQSYTRAAGLFPQCADVQYRLGDCLWRLTNAAAGRRHLQGALDADTLPFRADSRINQILAQAAGQISGEALAWCDAAAALASASPAGSPGAESFYEHVHLNFEGNYRLARAWAVAVEQLLPPAATRRAVSAWASQERCERLLGLTDWNRVSVLEEIVRRTQAPPFVGQWENARRVAELQQRLRELRQGMAERGTAPARQVYAEALQRAPEDARLHENFAEFLEATGDLPSAARARRKVCELVPHDYFPYYALGRVLKDQGQLGEAREALLKAAALHPNQGEIRLQLGMVCARQKQWEAAWRELARARQLSPNDARVCLYAGEVLGQLNRRAEALASLREALRLNPDYWEARFRLGEALAREGRMAEAALAFQEVLRIHPRYVQAHVSLAMAWLALGRNEEAARQFEETLQLDPQHPTALEFKRESPRQPP